MRIFLDTNVLLDALVLRDNPQFARDAATILSLGENKTIELCMSSLSIQTIWYVLKNMSPSVKKTIIKDIVEIVKALPPLPSHFEDMLSGPMSDIEAALQVQSALKGRCDIIVTRNIHDFKLSEIPAITPDDLLSRIIK